jgi:hypothetical protein
MTLSAFIRDHHEDIIREFAAFARTQMPPGADMSEEQLRDHAKEILIAVVHDMSIAQTSNEQALKSRMIASNTGSRSGQCSRNFAPCARPSFGCTRTAVRSTSAKSFDSTKLLTSH